MWITYNFIGSFVWFGTYQYLEKFPIFEKKNNLINGIIGFGSSVACDIVTNPLRNIKIYKQSYNNSLSYVESITQMINDK
jgi:hypothetical protein